MAIKIIAFSNRYSEPYEVICARIAFLLILNADCIAYF